MKASVRARSGDNKTEFATRMRTQRARLRILSIKFIVAVSPCAWPEAGFRLGGDFYPPAGGCLACLAGDFSNPPTTRRTLIVRMNLLTVADLRPHDEYYRRLEQGGIVYFPVSPFPVPADDQDLLLKTAQTSGSHHKNIAYRPAEDRVSNFDSSAADPERLLAALRGFSQRTLAFLREVFPRYMENCRIDYASFRPQEEEGRDLPLNKRNDLLHVDAFPTRPTKGDMILRTFTNINPSKERVWIVSDPFRPLAERYAQQAGLARAAQGSLLATASGLLSSLGLPLKQRSAYDRFMLSFHDWLKANEDYQKNCPKYRFEFPPGSAWMVFTDVVPHAVLSGRYALEQTIMVRKENLLSTADAPIRILENLCGQPLAT